MEEQVEVLKAQESQVVVQTHVSMPMMELQVEQVKALVAVTQVQVELQALHR